MENWNFEIVQIYNFNFIQAFFFKNKDWDLF